MEIIECSYRKIPEIALYQKDINNNLIELNGGGYCRRAYKGNNEIVFSPATNEWIVDGAALIWKGEHYFYNLKEQIIVPSGKICKLKLEVD